jgi:hypothetical protein
MRETHDPEATADLTAEVFAAIMLAARRYRAEKDTALPWVIGVAQNTLRSSSRTPTWTAPSAWRNPR